MSYAIIRTGGKQFNVKAGQVVIVPTISESAGKKVELEALLIGDGKKTNLDGGKVKATILSHGRNNKIIVFKKKRRKQYKRKYGHRQGFTEIKIDNISNFKELENVT